MNYLEIAGALIGLLYLWFEYRASIWLWPVSVIMPAIYIVVYYQVGLYADSVISIYYLLAGIYGWWMWLRHTPDKGEKPVSGTPSKLLLPMFVVLLVVFVLIGIILETCTDSTVSKAFRFCLSQERKRITIMGATGKREDHTIGNVSLLADYMEQAEVSMMTDYGIFVPIREDSMFESYIGQQISVFNMNSTALSAEGLAYPLSVFTNWWQGTLNEALARHFIIRTEGKVLVFRVF